MDTLRPQPGFQEQVLRCPADIAIVGGAAGCGKSWCSMVLPLAHVGHQNFSAVIFRRTYPELIGGGSIWEESLQLYSRLDGRPRFSTHEWRFPSGALISFSHLQRDSDRFTHQGKQYTLIIFEELTHFTEQQFWYLLSRNRSLCPVTPYVRATCNPDSDSFITSLISWWIDQSTGYPIPERSGVIRYFVRDGEELIWACRKEELEKRFPAIPAKSFTFIAGKLSDNKILTSNNPDYEASLKALPLVDRERLLFGNWQIKPKAGLYFRNGYFDIIDVTPSVRQVVRFWDKAATEKVKGNDPSWTVGVKMAKLDNGKYCVLHVERLRGTPGKVEETIRRIAEQDGVECKVGIFQDPGQAGVVDIDHMRKVLDGYHLRPYKVTKSKIQMAGPVSSQAEGGNISLLRGSWNQAYLTELESFPDAKHDDQVDATSGAYQLLQRKGLAHA